MEISNLPKFAESDVLSSMNAGRLVYLGEGKERIAICDALEFGKIVMLLQKLSSPADDQQLNDHWCTDMDYLFDSWNVDVNVGIVELSSAKVSQLVHWLESERPSGRSKTGTLFINHIVILQRDCRFVYCHGLNTMEEIDKSKALTIELKVKCGLKSSSPFVPQTRSIKKRLSRFQLIQCTKYLEGSMAPGGQLSWGIFNGLSSYAPEELCSREPGRVGRSLQALMRQPQNNLRINVGGVHVYGWDKTDAKLLYSEVGATYGGTLDTGRKVSDGAFQLLTHILCAESVLQRLVEVQDLDVLDVEGAALIYARLMGAFGGTHEATHSYLRKQFQHRIDMSGGDRDTLSIVDKLRALRVSEHTTDEECECRRRQATELIQLATAEECAHLLQLFMVALVARDVSVVVALQPASALPAHAGQNGSGITLETAKKCGIVHNRIIPPGPWSERECVLYSIRILDLRMKSLDKLWKKDLEEDAICAAAEKVLSMLVEEVTGMHCDPNRDPTLSGTGHS